MNPVRIGTRTSPLALKQVDEVLGYLREFYPPSQKITCMHVDECEEKTASGDVTKLTSCPRSKGITPASMQKLSKRISAYLTSRGKFRYHRLARGVFHPEIKAEIIGIDTYGDKDKITPISEIEGTDFFTREIDQALLRGDIDFAVHSAKDLPEQIPAGLVIAAITKSIDPYDALVSKGNLKINQLRPGAKIGTSSLRRKTQLKKYRRDFQIQDIRGNIEERLEKLDEDGLDAIIVASCALMRLGLEHRITQRIPFEILTPHPLQGSLAIAARENDREIINLFSKLDTRRKI